MASRLGSQIAKFRSEFGLTQKEAAALLGIGTGTISNIETGAREPRAVTAATIRTAMKDYRSANNPVPATTPAPAADNYQLSLASEFVTRIAERTDLPEDVLAEARLVSGILSR